MLRIGFRVWLHPTCTRLSSTRRSMAILLQPLLFSAFTRVPQPTIWSALAMQEFTGKGDIEKERKEIRDVRNPHPTIASLHTFAPSAAMLTMWNRARSNAAQVSCCNMCVLSWACRYGWRRLFVMCSL